MVEKMVFVTNTQHALTKLARMPLLRQSLV